MDKGIEKVDQMLADCGLEWRQGSGRKEKRTFRKSKFVKNYLNSLQENVAVRENSMTWYVNSFVMVRLSIVDKRKFFAAFGHETQSSDCPIELLEEVSIYYQGEKNTPGCDWSFQETLTDAHQKYLDRKKKMYRVKSIAHPQITELSIYEELRKDMYKHMNSAILNELKSWFEEKIILELDELIWRKVNEEKTFFGLPLR